MSLVPIVYTSLVLFFGFLLIVVTISYLTFKSRSKVNPVIEEEIKNHEKKLFVIRQNQYLAQQPAVQVQNYSSFQSVNTNQEVSELNRQIRVVPSQYFTNAREKYEPVKQFDRANDYPEKYNYEKSKKTIVSLAQERRTNRIEIMNQTPKYYNQVNSVNRKETRNYNVPQIEFNMLNFYSDAPDTNFNNITASNRAI